MSSRNPWEVVPLGRGRYALVSGSERRVAHAVRSGAETWVFLNGRVHVIGPLRGRLRTQSALRRASPEPSTEAGRAERRPGRHDDQTALAAPMPATVVAVNVEPGQQVATGDVLVTLEAMKMELAIKAPRQATVRRIACRAGELVQPGVPLVELDDGTG